MENEPNKILGIYWGRKSLFLAQIVEDAIPISTSVSFSSEAKDAEFNPFSAEGSDLVSNLTTVIKQNRITADRIYLSLPSKDIIFRSFIIPWMQKHEVADVVEFEASKYIPFSLEELSYTFNTMDMTEGTTKRIRVVFAAIKQTTLDTYNALLEQAKVTISNVEPAPISLIRALVSYQQIQPEETIALIEKDGVHGKIFIVHELTPLFVREFHLTQSHKATDNTDQDAVITRLKNEIRISLDYFVRQESNLQVAELLLISEPDESERIKTELERDLGIATRIVDYESHSPETENKTIEGINAYGACLHEQIDSVKNFDLIEITEEADLPVEFDIKNIDYKSLNYKLLGLFVAGCILLTACVFGFKKITLKKAQEKITTLETQLGMNKARTADSLAKKTEAIENKIAVYESIRQDGIITDLLTTISQSLPEEAWIENLNLNYYDNSKKNSSNNKLEGSYKLDIDISGFVYTENTSDHIGVINNFVSNLEKNEAVTGEFDRIRIDSASLRDFENFRTTRFSLDFVQK